MATRLDSIVNAPGSAEANGRPQADACLARIFLLEVDGKDTRERLMSFLAVLVSQGLAVTLLLIIPLFFPAKFIPMRNYLAATALTPKAYFPIHTQKVRPAGVQVVRKLPPLVEPVQKASVYTPSMSSPRHDAPRRNLIVNLPDPPNLKDSPPSPVLPDVSSIPALEKPRELVAVDDFDSAKPPTNSSGPRALVNTTAFSPASHVDAGATQEHRRMIGTTFGNVAGGPPLKRTVVLPETPTIVPVEILQEQKPAYTKDARDNKIEGDVILQVLFSASGVVEVQRVIRGLGYGLESSAEAAARQIRFRPALKDGVPVDSTALVHVKFQLAY